MEGQDLILKSRVRLVRNIHGHSFPDQCNLEEGDRITEKILEAMKHEKEPYTYYRLRDLDYLKQLYFMENQWISIGSISQIEKSSFFLSDDEKISIMIGEEDHLRLQCMDFGLSLTDCYYRLSSLEERLDESLGFAFDRRLGFLTACPSNLGTGLKASVQIHLPALEHDGMSPIYRSLSKMGFEIRELYGTNVKPLGSIYEISNEKTLGNREEHYLSRLEKIALELVQMEMEKRKNLYFEQRVELEDMVYRAFGTLRYSKKISYEEAMDCLSMIKLGTDLSLLKPKKAINIYTEMNKIQNATLQKDVDYLLKEEEKQEYRAKYLNRLLKEVY
ncbi:MAG: hypothetical protein Q4Q07_07125 [Tissierellia bacterium]|nr:hypothetical protein [Tissierellia bacterium]